MTEDLITKLARWREIGVVARVSSLAYEGKAVDVRNVAREVGVRYVLEGTVRRSGDEVRVTAQLIDGETGQHVWADRFDERGTDLLRLQDRVAQKIVVTLTGSQGVIRDDEVQKARVTPQVALDEYEYFLRGHDLAYRFQRESMAEALEIWQEGLARYPDSGFLKIAVGWAHHMQGRYGWVEDPDAALERAGRLVEEGLADPHLPVAGQRYGLWLEAFQDLYRGKYDAAIRSAEEAVEAFPYDIESLFWMADVAVLSGANELAEEWVERALQRSGLARPHPSYFAVIGRLRFAQGQYEEAIAAYENDSPRPERSAFLAAAHTALGNLEAARKHLRELKEEFPAATPDSILRYRPFRDASVRTRFESLLKKAGWAP